MNTEKPNTERRDDSRRAVVMTWGSFTAAIALSLTLIGGAVGILNWLYSENNRLRGELIAVRVEMFQQQSNKVSKEDFQASVKELSERFERGFDRLERRLVLLTDAAKKRTD